LRSITIASADGKVSAICLNLATHLLSSALSSFSSFKMTMSTSLLHTEQWAAWSRHLQLLQHSLKCFDIQQHFKKSIILHFWQSVQLTEINMPWLWIKITLMYNSQWVLIWFNVIQFCTNRTLSSSRARMIIVWEKWAYKASCCWSTSRTELTLTFTQIRTAM